MELVLNFINQFLINFGSSSQNVLIADLKSSRFDPFEANIKFYQFGPISDIMEEIL